MQFLPHRKHSTPHYKNNCFTLRETIIVFSENTYTMCAKRSAFSVIACGTYNNHCVGFEVFTAVVLKSIVFWDMTPCSS
jgi:hypothetical protein